MNRILNLAYRREFQVFLIKVFALLEERQTPLQLSWYIRAICHALTDALERDGARWVITVPPRHLKSIAAAVAFPAFVLGRDPTRKIMVATYSQELARLHATQSRAIMHTPWYRELFPGTRISEDGDRMLEILTTAGGGRKAVSVNGTVTGFGADFFIIDDCLKADDARKEAVREETRAWVDGTLLTRANQLGGGAVISISQRLHEADVAAHLLEKGYRELCLPAIAEKDERIPIGGEVVHHRKVGDLLGRPGHDRAKLEAERVNLGAQVFSAQFQQNPVAPEGNLIRMEWFETYDEPLPREQYHKVVQSWDTAVSDGPNSDYSVCTTWGFRDGKWSLLDVLRQRLAYPDLKAAVLRLHQQWKADKVIIELAGSGHSLWHEFRAERRFKPIMMKVTEDKETRVNGVTGQLSAGRVLLPVSAPWLEAFRTELRSFPYGKHDDQVDSMTQFLEFDIAKRAWVDMDYDEDGRPMRIRRREVNRRPMVRQI